MLKREMGRQLILILGFFVFLTFFHWSQGFSLIFLVLGLLLGYFLLNLDQMIYCYFQAPHELSSQRIKRLFEQKQYREGLILLLQTRGERERIIFHSVFFQVVLLVVCFFVLTSSSSLLGKGLVLGLLFHSLFDQLESFREEGQINNWFWQFQTVPNKNIQVFYFVFMLLIFLLFNLFLI